MNSDNKLLVIDATAEVGKGIELIYVGLSNGSREIKTIPLPSDDLNVLAASLPVFNWGSSADVITFNHFIADEIMLTITKPLAEHLLKLIKLATN